MTNPRLNFTVETLICIQYNIARVRLLRNTKGVVCVAFDLKLMKMSLVLTHRPYILSVHQQTIIIPHVVCFVLTLAF